MTTLLARLRCVLIGHDWESGLPSGHDWCRRCKRYDDHPTVLRADTWRAALRWLPFGIRLHLPTRDLSARVGLPRLHWSPSIGARLHFGWNTHSELPGIVVTFNFWRLGAWAGVGFGWQGEDGDRSLFQFGASVETHGLARTVCRYFGHTPANKTTFGVAATKPFARSIYCGRCDELIEPSTGTAA